MAKTDIPVKFRLLKIKTIQFATFDQPRDNKEKNISAQLAFNVNPEEKSILVYFDFEMKIKDKPFILLKTGCEFVIESWDDLIKDTKLAVPAGFARHLGIHVIGTARGILHAKTESTEFNHFPIPLINLQTVVPEGFAFDL